MGAGLVSKFSNFFQQLLTIKESAKII